MWKLKTSLYRVSKPFFSPFFFIIINIKKLPTLYPNNGRVLYTYIHYSSRTVRFILKGAFSRRTLYTRKPTRFTVNTTETLSHNSRIVFGYIIILYIVSLSVATRPQENFISPSNLAVVSRRRRGFNIIIVFSTGRYNVTLHYCDFHLFIFHIIYFSSF